MSDSESREVNVMSDEEHSADGNSANGNTSGNYITVKEFQSFKKRINEDLSSLRMLFNNAINTLVDENKKLHELLGTQTDQKMQQIDLDPIVVEHVKNKILLSGNTKKYSDIIEKMGFVWNDVFECYIVSTSDTVKVVDDVKTNLSSSVKIIDKTKQNTLVISGESKFEGKKSSGGKIVIEIYKNSLKVSGETMNAKEILKDFNGTWNSKLKSWIFFKKDKTFIDSLIKELSEQFTVVDRTNL